MPFGPTQTPQKGFTSSSATSSNVNQSLSNCQQSSIDYGHSPYSTAASGYPVPYYTSSPTIGSATSTALYQHLASQISGASSSSVTPLIPWESSPEDEFKSKISKKNHHYISESNVHYHPLDSQPTLNGKSTIELLSSHANSSSKKGKNKPINTIFPNSSRTFHVGLPAMSGNTLGDAGRPRVEETSQLVDENVFSVFASVLMRKLFVSLEWTDD